MDISSGLIWTNAHCSKKVSDCISHVLLCIATMGKPHHLKPENAPAYTSSAFAQFCNQWNIVVTHKIPHNLTGQTLVECTHQTLKMCLLKQKLHNPIPKFYLTLDEEDPDPIRKRRSRDPLSLDHLVTCRGYKEFNNIYSTSSRLNVFRIYPEKLGCSCLPNLPKILQIS